MQVCIFSPVFVLFGLYETVARKRENTAPPFFFFVTKVTKSRLSIQSSKKWLVRGLVKFTPAVA